MTPEDAINLLVASGRGETDPFRIVLEEFADNGQGGGAILSYCDLALLVAAREAVTHEKNSAAMAIIEDELNLRERGRSCLKRLAKMDNRYPSEPPLNLRLEVACRALASVVRVSKRLHLTGPIIDPEVATLVAVELAARTILARHEGAIFHSHDRSLATMRVYQDLISALN